MKEDITTRFSPDLAARSIGAQIHGEDHLKAGEYEAALAKVRPVIRDTITHLGAGRVYEPLVIIRFESSFKLGIDYQTFEDAVELFNEPTAKWLEIGSRVLRYIGRCLLPSLKLAEEDFEHLWDQIPFAQQLADRQSHRLVASETLFRDPVTLPVELFCQTMRFVEPYTRIKARRVSRSWDSAIKDNKFLWDELDVQDYRHRRDWEEAFHLSRGGIRAFSIIHEHDQHNAQEWRQQFCDLLASPGSSHLTLLHDEVAAFGSIVGRLEEPHFAHHLRELRTTCIHVRSGHNFPPDVITRSLGLFPNLRKVAVSRMSNQRSTPLTWPDPGALLKLETLELIGEVNCVWPRGHHSRRRASEVISFPISCIGEAGLAKAAPALKSITLRSIGYPIAVAKDDGSNTMMLEAWKRKTFDFSSFGKLQSLTLELDQWHPLPLLPAGLERLDINHHMCSTYTYADYTGVPPHLPNLKTLAINTDAKIGDKDSMWRRILTNSGCHLEELTFRDAPLINRRFAGAQNNQALQNFECSEWERPLLETLKECEQLGALKSLTFSGHHWDTWLENSFRDMLVESCKKLATLELDFVCRRGGLDPLFRMFVDLRGLQMLQRGHSGDGTEFSRPISGPWINMQYRLHDSRRQWYETYDAESYRFIKSSAQHPVRERVQTPN